MGKDVKVPQLVKRQDVGIRDVKKNLYLTVEMPQGMERIPQHVDINKQIHYAK